MTRYMVKVRTPLSVYWLAIQAETCSEAWSIAEKHKAYDEQVESVAMEWPPRESIKVVTEEQA